MRLIFFFWLINKIKMDFNVSNECTHILETLKVIILCNTVLKHYIVYNTDTNFLPYELIFFFFSK